MTDRTQTTVEPLTIESLGVIPDHPKVLAVYLSREPTEMEFLAIHDALWKIINEG